MSQQEIKNQIIKSVDTIAGLDISKLYVDGQSIVLWNNLSTKEVKVFVNDIVALLKKIKKNNSVLNTLAPGRLNELKTQLESFISQFQSFESTDLTQVTSQHHGSLNSLEALSNSLRSTGLYTELKLIPDLSETTKKLRDANDQLKEFSVTEFEKAISLVRSLIEQKISFEEKTIKENLGTFLNRANEHKIYVKRNRKELTLKFWEYLRGQWGWLFGAVIMGAVVAFIITSFITLLKDNISISIGAAILRISSLIVPSYFMVFFISQFTYHKKMYEIYSFKNTALNIMTDLMRTNQEKADVILGKGLEVLFTEPKIKEGEKYDPRLVNELIAMLKTQVGK